VLRRSLFEQQYRRRIPLREVRASTGLELRWQIPAVEQPLRLDLAINPLRLARLFLLDGSRFRAPDRLLGWTWGRPSFLRSTIELQRPILVWIGPAPGRT
jgi:hypothetical protein